MDSFPRCGVVFPFSCHKSTSGRSSSRWRAGRATSSRRRGTGRSRRVAGARRSEWEERKKSRVASGSLCEPRKNRKTVTPTTDCCFFSICRGRECDWLLAAATSSEDGDMWTGNHCGTRSTAVEVPEHSRALGGALCKSRKTVVRTFRVSLRHDTIYDQASLRLHQFRKTSNAAGAGIRFICTRGV